MPSVSASEFLAFVSTTRLRLLALERRYVPPARPSADFNGQSFSYFQVVKPILPGQTGTGRKVTFSTKITSDPGDPIEYEGWLEQSSGELEIHDSGYRTLALEGDIIVAEYRYNKWRTFTEFGITNVRVRVFEDVTPTGGPPPTPLEAKYQVIVGDAKIPQFYEGGDPVVLTRMTSVPLTAGSEFLLSYDRADQTWFVVETGGGGANIAIARCQQNVTHLDDTFDATIGAVITGQATILQDIVVHNLRVGQLQPDFSGSVVAGYPGILSENIFVLVKGQFVIVVQREDGEWQILQSGAVYNSSALESGGGGPGDPAPPPDDPPPGDPPPGDPPPDDPPPGDPPPDDPPPDDPPPPPPPPPDDPPPDEPSDPSDPSDP